MGRLARDPPVAFVLAGGLGTRLRTVVGEVPKVLAPVGGRPFLAALLEDLGRAGIDRAVLCTGHKAEEVEAVLGDGAALGIALAYSREPEPLGTGGAVRLALARHPTPTALVLNGDTYCAFEPGELVALHRARGAAATLVAVEVADPSRFGSLRLGRDDRVEAFVEKGAAKGPAWINAGIYVFEAATLEAAGPAGARFSLETDLLAPLAGRGLHALKTRGRFVDIGVPADYLPLVADGGGLFRRPPRPAG